MNAALGMLLPFGAKGFHGKMGVKGGTVKNVDNGTVWKDIKVTQPLYEGTKIQNLLNWQQSNDNTL